MPGKKRFFGILRKVPETKAVQEEVLVVSSSVAGGQQLAAAPPAAPRTPTGLEIPAILADDSGAAIDNDHPAGVVEEESSGGGVARGRLVSLEALPPCSSPSPSADRLSVSFSPDLVASPDDDLAAMEANGDSKVRFSRNSLSALSPPGDDEDDDELSESLDAVCRGRKESGRRRSIRRSPKRGSSPFGSDSESVGKGRRRSSTMTSTSCEETQISIEAEPELTEEQMFESIRLHKELIEAVKKQPWKMTKRLKIVRRAKAFVKKHEGELELRLAQSKNTKDIMARYTLIFLRYWERLKREAANLAKNMVPWEMRIKRIESHFGSVVASYFIFLRWVFWINIVMSIFISCFVIVPEVLAADRSAAGDRKELMPDEEAKAFNLQTLWDFEGFLKYSPIFYGYYTNTYETREGYRIPFAYFLTLLGMYGYSFAAILRRMAENTRMSTGSDNDDDCTFTWKLFTGWDYIIGHSETADNKVASLLMGFKENILEEREKKKEERSWKIFGLRVLANFMVLILLLSSAYAVVKVVERSQAPEAEESWWRQNEVTVIISLISILYPNFFDLIGMLEHNHPRIQLRWQLARIMILYLLNLYTLIFALFSKVDDMSKELQTLRPNTTVAPTPSSTTPLYVLPSIPGIDWWPNGKPLTPYFNASGDGHQLPAPDDPFSQIFEALNLSMWYHHIWRWNDTCLAVRVHCDTKLLLDTRVNDSWANDGPSSSPASFSSTPQWDDYDSGFMDASAYTHSMPSPLVANAASALYNVTSDAISAAIQQPILNLSLAAHTLPLVFLPRELIAKFNLTPTSSGSGVHPGAGPPYSGGRAEALTDDFRFRLASTAAIAAAGASTARPASVGSVGGRSGRNRTRAGRNRTRENDARGGFTPSDRRDSPSTPLGGATTDTRFTRSSGADSAPSGGAGDLPTTAVPSSQWNETGDDIEPLLMDSPYYSTPFPDEEAFLSVAPGYCLMVKCLDEVATTTAYPTRDYDDYGSRRYGGRWSTARTNEPSSTPYFGSSDLPSTPQVQMHPVDESEAEVADVEESETETVNKDGLDIETRTKLRKLCWETMFGQELVKLTIMDLVMTTISILVTDFIRALIVRVMNHCCCWDLEKQFPGYGDFKIAENILHLVNNQGMIWMGMFFSPGIPGVNMIKVVILMYVRSWAVLTCNIPHETVFKASSSSNFYYSLLLTMLFLCTLPVGYAVVWLEPSWHCGPFSQYTKIYRIFTTSLERLLPDIIIRALDYAASPGIVIPLLVLLILVIYYLNSVANSLKEANKDLKIQLRRERTEERRKVFQMADARHDPPNAASKWANVMKKILPGLPSKVKMLQAATRPLMPQAQPRPTREDRRSPATATVAAVSASASANAAVAGAAAKWDRSQNKKSSKQVSEDDNSEMALNKALQGNCVKIPKEKLDLIVGIHNKMTRDKEKKMAAENEAEVPAEENVVTKEESVVTKEENVKNKKDKSKKSKDDKGKKQLIEDAAPE